MFKRITHRKTLEKISQLSHEIANLYFEIQTEDKFYKKFSYDLKNETLFLEERKKKMEIINELLQNIEILTKKRTKPSKSLEKRVEILLKNAFRLRNITITGGDQLYITLKTMFSMGEISRRMRDLEFFISPEEPDSAPMSPEAEQALKGQDKDNELTK